MAIQRFNIAPIRKFLDNGSTILVPNQKIRDAILYGYASESPRSSLFTPDVNAVDIWLKNQWTNLANQGIAPFSSLQLLDSMQESLIWIDIIEQNQQQARLLNPEEAAATAQHAYQLYRLWLDEGGKSRQLPAASGMPELQQFSRWCRTFDDYCREHQVICLADATLTLTEDISGGHIKVADNIVVVNFYQPPPLYKKLFHAVTDGAQERFVQTADEQQTAKGLAHTFNDLETEARACAHWARQLTQSQPDAHIGVIFSGTPDKLSVIDRAFKDCFCAENFVDLIDNKPVLNDGVSKTALLDQRLIDEALLLLGLGNPRLSTADFCHLLQSSTLPGYQQELGARIQLEIHIRQNLGTDCSLSQLMNIMSREKKSYYCPILLNALMTLANQVRHVRDHTPRHWARLFQEQLTNLGWPYSNTEFVEARKELLRAWQSVLSCLGEYRTANGNINRSTALSRLRTLCKKTAFNAPFSSTTPVSLIELNDAVGLHFDHVWLLGFDDNSQPAAASPSPFLAHNVQRQAAIPGSHSNLQLALARQAFRIVCASTGGQVHGSYHQLEGDETLRASSLLDNFTDTELDYPKPPYLNRLALEFSRSVEIEESTVDMPVILESDETTRGGQAVFSDQSSCPFRAFAAHRLNCRALEPLTNGLDAGTRGTALHIALEQLFSKITDRQQLQQSRGNKRQELITQCSNDAIRYLESRNPELMTPRFKSLERDRLQQLLNLYLEIEEQRDEFQVVAVEKNVSWHQEPLDIRLKIDRIDRLKNGSLAIIDYKTGKYVQSNHQLTEERPTNLQLPVYYWATTSSLEEKVEAVVIAQINSEKTGFSGKAAKDHFHPQVKSIDASGKIDRDWSSLTHDWQVLLAKLANEFIHGVARVEPANTGICKNCHYQPLCRIRQLSPLQEVLDQDEQEYP